MKYYIAKKRDFFGPKSEYSWVEDEYKGQRETGLDAACEFNALADAQAWIDAQRADIYVLAHNESNRPEYKILDEDAAYRLQCVWDHDDLGGSQYDWDHCADPENPTDEEEIAACNAINDAEWASLECLSSLIDVDDLIGIQICDNGETYWRNNGGIIQRIALYAGAKKWETITGSHLATSAALKEFCESGKFGFRPI